MIAWLPLGLLKYVAMLAIVVVTYFYAHHSGYHEAEIEYKLKEAKIVSDSLTELKHKQEENQQMQTALTKAQQDQERLYTSKNKQIVELKRKYQSEFAQCRLSPIQSQEINKLLGE